MTKRILCLCASIFFGSPFAGAEISPYVPPFSGAYETVERLEALGCAFPTLRILGPQSFLEMKSAVDWDPQTTQCKAPSWLLDERELLMRGALPVEFRSDGYGAFDDRVALPGISASVVPMFPLRENRPVFTGINVSNEAFLSGRAGGNELGYAGAITPGFYGGYDSTSGHLLGRFYIQEMYLKLGYGFSEFTFGRYARRFGDARHGNLLFSGATAPLDTLEYTLRPLVLPGAMSALGPISLRTWLGNQGNDTNVAGTRLWGIELGVRPFHWWELGVIELFQFGGVGAPALGLGEILSMSAFGGGLADRRHASVGIATSFWGPAHRAKLYGQVLWNRIGDTVDAPFSYQAGLWFPSLGGFDARFEYVKTARAAYQHSFWTQGLSYAGSTMGHPIGPDGEGLYADFGLPPIATWWRAEVGALMETRGQSYTGTQTPESRMGGSVSFGRRWGLADLQVKIAFHHITGAQYVPGAGIESIGAGAVFRYTFLQ